MGFVIQVANFLNKQSESDDEISGYLEGKTQTNYVHHGLANNEWSEFTEQFLAPIIVETEKEWETGFEGADDEEENPLYGSDHLKNISSKSGNPDPNPFSGL